MCTAGVSVKPGSTMRAGSRGCDCTLSATSNAISTLTGPPAELMNTSVWSSSLPLWRMRISG